MTTQLIFPNFNTNIYSANNDLGNPFVLNAVTSQSWSQVSYTANGAAGSSLHRGGQPDSQRRRDPFTGGLFLNGNATLNFTSDAQLGAAGGAITLNGGGLNFNPAPAVKVTLNRPLALGPAGGAVSGITGNSLTLAGDLSGSSPLTIGGTTTVNSGAAVTLSGTTTPPSPDRSTSSAPAAASCVPAPTPTSAARARR